MKPQKLPRFVYSRDRDGCDDTFDIWDIHTNKVITSVYFWDSIEGEEDVALDEADQIAREFNLHGPRHVRAFDDVA